ncbi:PH domain-containing protein [Flavobacterium sp. J27]|uniref:PH domain-containing protein n=1 Tax=Flavobacterium sp. J27 TaxID=2060419 RepID=UPI00102FD358|nr:PH domain-containing protein [Flavobacterium sp. J27]
MLDNLKKILNEDQDPKAIEKITSKLENLIMTNEEVGYIAVQKKPAITIFPDSIVVTNKRIILCKPKNLGLSMEFVDYDWEDIEAAFVKEGILGTDFTFTTKTQLTQTIDYLPKNQARKLYTYAKEQLDQFKKIDHNTIINKITVLEDNQRKANEKEIDKPSFLAEETQFNQDEVEETMTEEVFDFAEIIPADNRKKSFEEVSKINDSDDKLSELSPEELFEKLQNYKRLLDNGLILQGEYDKLKASILKYM